MSMLIKIIIFLVMFSVLVIVHEGGHMVIGKMSGIGVKEFSIGWGPVIWSTHKTGTLFSLRALPFGGVTIYEGDDPDEPDSPTSFRNSPPIKRLATVMAGPFMNFVLAFLLSLIVIGSVGYDLPVLSSVIPGYPAEEAGIQAGDKIISLDGKKMKVYRDISAWTLFHDATPVKVVYERDGKQYETVLTPKYSSEDDRYLFGFTGPKGYTKGNPLQVIKYSFVEVRYWIEVTLKSIGSLFRGKSSVNDLAGPVGMAGVVGDVYDSSVSSGVYYVWINMLSLMILLSADLGVMNLLPFPAIDGGRMLFIIYELITGKRPNVKVEGVINLIGAAFILVLMFYVMFHDIWGIFTG